MNLEVLEFLLETEHYIEDKVKEAKLDLMASVGIGKQLLANKGDLSALSDKQLYHYNNVLKPLFENVVCDGPVGFIEDDEGNWETSCVNGGIIDDESLYQSYLEEDFKCQICRYDAEKMI